MSITSSKEVISQKQTKQVDGMRATITAQLHSVRKESIDELKQLSAQLRKDNEALTQKKNELEERLTLQAARKVQSEYDKALAAQAKEDNSGVSITRNVLTQADLIEVQMLAIVNNKRASKGLEPFKDYAAYLASFEPTTLGQKINPPSEKVDPVTPLDKLIEQMYDANEGRPVKAQGEVYQVVSGGYYIGWNKSRAYIQKVDTGGVSILVHGDTLYGDSALMSIIPNKSFRDLTRAEVDNILKGKPSYKDLFKAYSKLQNYQNVYLDTKNALPVW
jgi:BMFP domain-containing protein YqiC